MIIALAILAIAAPCAPALQEGRAIGYPRALLETAGAIAGALALAFAIMAAAA